MPGLLSMTGFGKANSDAGKKKITIEIRSLNSKQFDLNTKMPGLYREKELEIRSLLAEKLVRGKIDFSLNYASQEEEKKLSLQHDLALQYYRDIKKLAESLDQTEGINYMELILKMPDVLQSEKSEINEEEWLAIREIISNAADDLTNFRIAEGKMLEADIRYRIGKIDGYRMEAEKLFSARSLRIKERLEKHLSELAADERIDTNRLEQEIIYYMEKLDITEENVRLAGHCNYFLETISAEPTPGRKLGFISQEIGREINTMGSKANHAEIQKLVVQMKDELEKIKEQLLNIL